MRSRDNLKLALSLRTEQYNKGNTRQGLMMPEGFDITQSLLEQPVIFEAPYQVRVFLTQLSKGLGSVHSLDEMLSIKPDAKARFNGAKAEHYIFTVPQATEIVRSE